MILASFFFASMGVGIKVAASSFSTFELLFYRGVVSVIFMGLVLRARRTSVRTRVPMMHAWRTFIGVLALGAWFYSIAHLPLATSMALNYMSGIWVAAFIVGGAVMHGQAARQGPLLATVLAGFAGVVLLLRPTLDQNQFFAGVIGLLSGISSALSYLMVTALAKAGEPEGRTVFYFSVGSVIAGSAGIAFTGLTPWSAVSWQAATWLIPIGVLAALGQWCMTRAFSQGSTLLVVNLQYSGLVFAAFYSLLLFGDQIPLLGWAGMGLIIVSGVAATVLRTRVLPDTPAEEH